MRKFSKKRVSLSIFSVPELTRTKKGGNIDLLTECRNKPVPFACAMCLAIYQNIFGEQSLI
ncbi:MAG: hypothetical protein B6245_05095 [Desulfobacteraceae bacterium 4572_88]|nr:MAG: hypothetical protein B6245_05095 [Desulfobacteraceae bacterium 4572_88]